MTLPKVTQLVNGRAGARTQASRARPTLLTLPWSSSQLLSGCAHGSRHFWTVMPLLFLCFSNDCPAPTSSHPPTARCEADTQPPSHLPCRQCSGLSVLHLPPMSTETWAVPAEGAGGPSTSVERRSDENSTQLITALKRIPSGLLCKNAPETRSVTFPVPRDVTRGSCEHGYCLWSLRRPYRRISLSFSKSQRERPTMENSSCFKERSYGEILSHF